MSFASGGEVPSVAVPSTSNSPVNLNVSVNPASKEFGGSLTFPDQNSLVEMINLLGARLNEMNISMLNQKDSQNHTAPGLYR